MNVVTISGNLIKDPWIQKNSVVKYVIAVESKFKREPDLVQCTAFSKIGEAAMQYLKKGSQVAIMGSLQISSTNNFQSEILVSNQEFYHQQNENMTISKESIKLRTIKENKLNLNIDY